MKIVPVTAFPTAARVAAHRKMQDLLSWEIVKVRADEESGQPLVLSFPHRVLWISIRDLREHRPLAAAAELRAWRFLVMSGNRVAAAVQAWNDRGTWRVSSIHTGVTATRTVEALKAADNRVNAQAEPCYIWCRAAWTAALWLRPLDGKAGAVVKLPGTAPSSEDDFMANLRKRVEARQPWPVT